MFLLGNLIAFIKSRKMTQVSVIARKERTHLRKMYSAGSDGYVYTIGYDDSQKPNRYLILFGDVADLFQPDPSLRFVNPDYLTKLEEYAKKHGDTLFNSYEAISKMDTPLKKGAFTDEAVPHDVLKALQEHEITRAQEFVKKCGGGENCYRPSYLKFDAEGAQASLPKVALG